MRFSLFIVTLLVAGTGLVTWGYSRTVLISGAPPYGIDEEEIPEIDPYAWVHDWVRPDGPAKVGIQVGHWKNDELPDELERLRGNTGSTGGGKSEWEVNLSIAGELKTLLEAEGITVDILPATVPEKYWADVFIAIHADGNTDSSVHGYKFAAPWRDLTGKADELVDLLNDTYEETTGLVYDPNISRNMRGYYAFSWWRHDHTIHPMTTAVIAETGFLTNYSDRQLLINTPEIPAQGIADAIISYLEREELL
ncbi:MAG: N-acetylmuramoyl-L-alanine amidase [Candidatus Roizmanbacteria bacterium]|nr:N-acetylmuramoyl-L-alanine amidase [Candidatus Roizmanbacteria bacterium]